MLIKRIDYATDKIIQDSIRRELKDITLITVAHRLQTIMDADRIVSLCYTLSDCLNNLLQMVLSQGSLVSIFLILLLVGTRP